MNYGEAFDDPSVDNKMPPNHGTITLFSSIICDDDFKNVSAFSDDELRDWFRENILTKDNHLLLQKRIAISLVTLGGKYIVNVLVLTISSNDHKESLRDSITLYVLF
jgi:hypothetical protein